MAVPDGTMIGGSVHIKGSRPG